MLFMVFMGFCFVLYEVLRGGIMRRNKGRVGDVRSFIYRILGFKRLFRACGVCGFYEDSFFDGKVFRCCAFVWFI